MRASFIRSSFGTSLDMRRWAMLTPTPPSAGSDGATTRGAIACCAESDLSATGRIALSMAADIAGDKQ